MRPLFGPRSTGLIDMSFLCTIPLLNALLSSCLPPLPLATGYVEGEYVLLAPVEIARIERIDVRRGDHIDPEQGVVFLERQDAEIAVAQARAALVQAESGLANISQGRRAAEIAAIDASGKLGKKIVTPVRKATRFYDAEAYHQDYYKSSKIVVTRRGPKSKAEAYKFYRKGCGRDARVKQLWGSEAAFAH